MSPEEVTPEDAQFDPPAQDEGITAPAPDVGSNWDTVESGLRDHLIAWQQSTPGQALDRAEMHRVAIGYMADQALNGTSRFSQDGMQAQQPEREPATMADAAGADANTPEQLDQDFGSIPGLVAAQTRLNGGGDTLPAFPHPPSFHRTAVLRRPQNRPPGIRHG